MDVLALVAAVVALVGAAAAGGVVILLARRIDDIEECVGEKRVTRRSNPNGLRIYRPEA